MSKIDPNDIVGKKFGKLIVEKYDGFYIRSGNRKKHFYICKCKCGGTKTIERRSLTKHFTKSCGCLRPANAIDTNDIIGKKFNMLTVKEYSGRYATNGCKHKRHFYICECKCGETNTVERNALTSLNTKSCGCLTHIKGKNNKTWKGFGDISGGYWSRLRCLAGYRNLKFKIKIKDVWELYKFQNGLCALTDLPICLSENEGHKRTASLDRIDSSKGYVKDNIQWVHKDINRIKSNLHQDRFVELCLLIEKHIMEGSKYEP